MKREAVVSREAVLTMPGTGREVVREEGKGSGEGRDKEMKCSSEQPSTLGPDQSQLGLQNSGLGAPTNPANDNGGHVCQAHSVPTAIE